MTDTVRVEVTEDDYVAWLRYVYHGQYDDSGADIITIEVCDSDAKDAFKAYPPDPFRQLLAERKELRDELDVVNKDKIGKVWDEAIGRARGTGVGNIYHAEPHESSIYCEGAAAMRANIIKRLESARSQQQEGK